MNQEDRTPTALRDRLRRWRERLPILLGRETARTMRHLREGSPAERAQAAQALRHLPLSPRDVQGLVAALDDPDPFVRWDVMETLIALGPKQAFSPCLRRATQGDPPEGLAAALRVLGTLADERALDTILTWQDHPHPDVRAAVADALSHFPQEHRAREALAALLADEHNVVRRAAVWALRHQETPWAQDLLAARAPAEPESWLRDLMQHAVTHNTGSDNHALQERE